MRSVRHAPRPLCECGGRMRWRRRWFRGFRTECACGRCGPWRLETPLTFDPGGWARPAPRPPPKEGRTDA